MDDLCNIREHRLGLGYHVFRLATGNVWRPQDVVELKQWTICGDRLIPIDIESSPTQVPALENFIQRFLVDNAAAR